ncbi:hypothetical protein DL98DRAFT_96534 [Cadophora sp. DSE1049]|nr:hypothetical protein DL98DRAFT_96534 [Cadophora sp. DSE1049]
MISSRVSSERSFANTNRRRLRGVMGLGCSVVHLAASRTWERKKRDVPLLTGGLFRGEVFT